MLKRASDADAPGTLVRALTRPTNGVDLVRVQDVHDDGTPDPVVLEWAARENRVLLSRDRSTMIGFARRRVQSGLPMAGLIVVSNYQSARDAEQEILLIAACCSEAELQGQVVFLPLSTGVLPSSRLLK